MEEAEYKKTYSTVALPCPFEKAILSTRCACALSQRVLLAERAAEACTAVTAQLNCVTLHGLLRQNAKFALKLTAVSDALPFAKEIKVQCGGLLGLQGLLDPGESGAARVRNIHDLVTRAQARFGGLQQVPFGEIVKAIAAYQHRARPGAPRT